MFELILICCLLSQAPEASGLENPMAEVGLRELQVERGCVTLQLELNESLDAPRTGYWYDLMYEEVGQRGVLEVCWDGDRWNVRAYDEQGEVLRRVHSDGEFVSTGDGHVWSIEFLIEYFEGDEYFEFNRLAWPLSVALTHLFPVSGQREDFEELFSSYGTNVVRINNESGHVRVEYYYIPVGASNSEPISVFDYTFWDRAGSWLLLSEGFEGHDSLRYSYGEAQVDGIPIAETCESLWKLEASADSPVVPLWKTTLIEVLEVSDDESLFEIDSDATTTIHYAPVPEPDRSVRFKPRRVIEKLVQTIQKRPLEWALGVVGIACCALALRIWIAVRSE